MAEAAVEAILDRTVIHAPEDVPGALDSTPGGCEGHGRMAGSSSREGFRSGWRATAGALRGICGPQDRLSATIAGVGGQCRRVYGLPLLLPTEVNAGCLPACGRPADSL